MNKKILDGRNWTTLPSVKNGSGVDKFVTRDNIAWIIIEEPKKVNRPTATKILIVLKTDDDAGTIGLS